MALYLLKILLVLNTLIACNKQCTIHYFVRLSISLYSLLHSMQYYSRLTITLSSLRYYDTMYGCTRMKPNQPSVEWLNTMLIGLANTHFPYVLSYGRTCLREEAPDTLNNHLFSKLRTSRKAQTNMTHQHHPL